MEMLEGRQEIVKKDWLGWRIRQKKMHKLKSREEEVWKLVGKKQEKKLDWQKIMQKELEYSKMYGNE